MAGARIVIVDDNPDDRAIEARLLTKVIPDLKIVEVSTAEGWAEVVESGEFDLVVTDYHLGWSDGLAVLAEVRKRWPERPVVMVTGTGTEEVAVEAMKSGAEDYVLKSRERIRRLPTVVRGALLRAGGRALDREARTQLERDIEQRATASASLARLQAGETPEATADAVCAEIRATLGLGIAAVEWFIGSDTIVLALASNSAGPFQPADILPGTRSAYLQGRAGRGPWIEDWTSLADDDPIVRRWRDTGAQVGAYVPLVRLGRPVGMIVAASAGPWSIEAIAARMPLLMEYAAVAAVLIEPAMASRREAVALASETRAIIAASAFRTVFQPIIGLSSRIVAGYEALTRFEDGTSPAVRFASARAAGVGVELELATLAEAIRSSALLPPMAFISLNVSAEVLFVAGDRALVAARINRPLVLEVTEHEETVDSRKLLRVVKKLGPDVRIAIDDAGAGYAGLRRVLELRPQFVKLDLELVRNIDRDPAREALIAGMAHFAREVDCGLIAEGIEREGERRVLSRLGVAFGQGYLLGRPSPAETWAAGAGPATATLPAAPPPTG